MPDWIPTEGDIDFWYVAGLTAAIEGIAEDGCPYQGNPAITWWKRGYSYGKLSVEVQVLRDRYQIGTSRS